MSTSSQIPYTRFGQWLQNQMLERKLNQTALARIARLKAPSIVSRYLSSDVEKCICPTQNSMYKIFSALGYSLEESNVLCLELSEAKNYGPLIKVQAEHSQDIIGLARALQLIGGYSSITAALTKMIEREVAEKNLLSQHPASS